MTETRRGAFLRYPGGKQRQLLSFVAHLPNPRTIRGRYVEPFVGGGAVFFHLDPTDALLSDLNPDLIDLYRGIRTTPTEAWRVFQSLPTSRETYYEVRGWKVEGMDLPTRTGRTLYLNRTCFKGMWRHNANGGFNVGYGGPDRRWAITRDHLLEVSIRLARAELRCSDFEQVIDECQEGDFVFVDPPYRPGAREIPPKHYRFGGFTFECQERLARALGRATKRGVLWAMTNSAHADIPALYPAHPSAPLLLGTGRGIGQTTKCAAEILITNYEEAPR